MYSVADMLGCEPASIPVSLARAKNVSLLWVNPRSRYIDFLFDWNSGGFAEYKSHLIESCAFEVEQDPSCHTHSVYGFADRYGGNGIGLNGGSGRAVIVNGYYVKGVGPTPLVSSKTDFGHANGAATLDEAVREAIFAEIVDAEFPCGALPTLAILSLGQGHTWRTPDGSLCWDARCLIVRPVPLRPAHFERASAFLCERIFEGDADRRRVEHIFSRAMAQHPHLAMEYEVFWKNWARQLSYGYVFRLPQCGVSTSNTCLDGRLMDFGATAAMPSWGRFSVVSGGVEVGTELQILISVLQDQVPFLRTYLDPKFGQSACLTDLMKNIIEAYGNENFLSVLRVIGLRSVSAKKLIDSSNKDELIMTMRKAFAAFGNIHLSIFRSTPDASSYWDLDEFWQSRNESYLRLRELIKRGLQELDHDDELAKRAKLRCRSRTALYRETIRTEIGFRFRAQLDGSIEGSEEVSSFIEATIVANRRDSILEPPGAHIIGFARAGGSNWVVFQKADDNSFFKMREMPRKSIALFAAPPSRTVSQVTDQEVIEYVHTDLVNGDISDIPPFAELETVG